jgi:hypothetical protein
MMRPLYRPLLKGATLRRKAAVLRVIKAVTSVRLDPSMASILTLHDSDHVVATVVILAAVAAARAAVDEHRR